MTLELSETLIPACFILVMAAAAALREASSREPFVQEAMIEAKVAEAWPTEAPSPALSESSLLDEASIAAPTKLEPPNEVAYTHPP